MVRLRWNELWIFGAALPLVCLTAGFLLAGAGIRHWAGSATGLLCLSVALISAVTDLRWRMIPNAITYPAAIGALVFAIASSCIGETSVFAIVGIGSPGWISALGGFALAFGLVFAIFLAAGFGAGDVKLAGVLGLCVGWPRIIETLLWSYASACGISIAVALVWFGAGQTLRGVLKGFAGAVVPKVQENLSADDRKIVNMKVPMGPFFFLGALIEVVRNTSL